MPKTPRSWPIGALPRRMTLEIAAYYCGCCPTKFRDELKAGRYPRPDPDGRFDRKLLDEAIDRGNGTPVPEVIVNNWKVVRPNAQRKAARR